jgi:hypothetical protein
MRKIVIGIWIGVCLTLLASCTPGPVTMQPVVTSIPPTPAKAPAPSLEIPKPTISTITAFPLTGSVVIEEGRCCISGFEGDTLLAQVDFSAASPFGKVTRMRVLESYGCASIAEMESVDWEPFIPRKTLPFEVAINWVGYHVSAQFQDEHRNVSPVYCDDISVEGSPRLPIVNPADWYPQIQCFSENEVHPGPGETTTGTTTIFSWPDRNVLPEGVFFNVYVYGAGDNYTALVAHGQTRETSMTLQIPQDRAGDMIWVLTLADANENLLDHGQCSSYRASLLTVNPPFGIKGIHFLYKP